MKIAVVAAVIAVLVGAPTALATRVAPPIFVECGPPDENGIVKCVRPPAPGPNSDGTTLPNTVCTPPDENGIVKCVHADTFPVEGRDYIPGPSHGDPPPLNADPTAVKPTESFVDPVTVQPRPHADPTAVKPTASHGDRKAKAKAKAKAKKRQAAANRRR